MKTRTTLFLFLLVLCSLCSCIKHDNPEYPELGDYIPAFAITLDDGTEITPSQMATSDCMLVFFHTECPDCQRELQVINDFAMLHPEKNIYAISRAEEKEQIQEYWQKNNLTLRYSAQTGTQLYSAFTDSGIPYTVISKNGKITGLLTDENHLTIEVLENLF